MTAATNQFPVDSTTRACCGGIGRHTPDCPESSTVTTTATVCPVVPLPAGARVLCDWQETDGCHERLAITRQSVRKLAAALLDAAAELDGWAAR